MYIQRKHNAVKTTSLNERTGGINRRGRRKELSFHYSSRLISILLSLALHRLHIYVYQSVFLSLPLRIERETPADIRTSDSVYSPLREPMEMCICVQHTYAESCIYIYLGSIVQAPISLQEIYTVTH